MTRIIIMLLSAGRHILFATSRFSLPTYLLTTALLVTMLTGASARAADNELTAREKAEGWQLLFNGRDLAGWKNNNDKPVAAKIQEGAINPHGSGGYLLVFDKPAGDFVFKCDVKMAQPECNSGIFVRTGDLSDPVNTGIEVQVNTDTKPDVHSFGAIYDLVAPSKNATHGADKWDAVEISCQGPLMTVTVNDEKVAKINCDEWRESGKGPDGTPNKFDKALKDFPRKGYIGLQDHGHDVWYKNIKLRKL
jgi:hypothetical protein